MPLSPEPPHPTTTVLRRLRGVREPDINARLVCRGVRSAGAGHALRRGLQPPALPLATGPLPRENAALEKVCLQDKVRIIYDSQGQNLALTRQSRPESDLDCPICAMFARQLHVRDMLCDEGCNRLLLRLQQVCFRTHQGERRFSAHTGGQQRLLLIPTRLAYVGFLRLHRSRAAAGLRCNT